MTKRHALTDTQIKGAKPGKLTQLTDGMGLYLKLFFDRAAGHSWRFDYKSPATGKRNTLVFGAYPTVSLKLARDKAQAARELIAQGVDPAGQREVIKAEQKAAVLAIVVQDERAARGLAPAGSLLGVCEDYHQGKLDTGDWTELHAAQWLGMVKRCLPQAVAHLPIASVRPVTILHDVVRPLERDGKVATSRTIRKYLAQVFDYAEVLELRQGNPARVVRGQCKQHVGEDLGNNPAMTTPAGLTQVLAAIRDWPTIVTRIALTVQAALFQRPSDTCGMKWADLDLDAALWTIEAAPHTKIAKSLKGNDHIVPLPSQVVDLLRTLKPITGHTEWVFLSPQNTGESITNDTLTNALRSMGFGGKQTAHGFRATARTILRERLKVNAEVIECQMAHSGATTGLDGTMRIDPLGAAYNRATHLDERTEMVQLWADYLDSLLTPKLVESTPAPVAEVLALPLAA